MSLPPQDHAAMLISLLEAVVDAGLYDADTGVWTGGSVDLVYNGVGPFSVPCLAPPQGNFSTALVQLTTGPDLITGLEDAFGNPLADGTTFPAIVFVEEGIIYDIIAINPFIVDSALSGIVLWQSPSVPILVINQSMFFMPGIPTSDPGIAGALWSNEGVVTVSAG